VNIAVMNGAAVVVGAVHLHRPYCSNLRPRLVGGDLGERLSNALGRNIHHVTSGTRQLHGVDDRALVPDLDRRQGCRDYSGCRD
jgi:hypothetical protein